MIKILNLKLLDYSFRKNKKIDSAFTLVELIVVVVIIGILSSIAVPAFRNASDKARQKEAATLIATYLKASQAYFTEFGSAPQDASNLSEYIQITGCEKATTTECSTSTPKAVTSGETWNAPSGAFTFRMKYSDSKTTFVGNSTSTPQGRGVTGCFNISTGAVKVINANTEGAVTTPSC
tara:strand:+ start:202 stop:738 length:537 start_codon:yes stop_codon:yes gene_type:complete